MKKIYRFIALLSGILLPLTSCNFLDVNPNLGISEDEVFSKWSNYYSYFKQVYDGNGRSNIKVGYPLFVDQQQYRFAWVATTDAADNGRVVRAQTIKLGTMGENAGEWVNNTSRCPIVYGSLHVIRVVNKCIENIDRLQDGMVVEVKDMLAQCYFLRAYAHFNLCRWYGGFPYLDHALGADDDWDLPRLSSYDTYVECAKDFQKAYEIFKELNIMRRDGAPGTPGHLRTDEDMGWPAGCAALAMKSRALLYAASPLSNTSGNVDAWKAAAEAAAEALTVCLANGYALLDMADWTKNTLGAAYTNEHIWAWNYGSSGNVDDWSGILARFQNDYGATGGITPTQNFIDRYETLDGDILTPGSASRQRAINLRHFNEQDPYSNLDPRFYQTIVYDGCLGNKGMSTIPINIYYDPSSGVWPTTILAGAAISWTTGVPWGSNDAAGYTNTGYYCQRYWNGRAYSGGLQRTDPLVRLAELYLNYAEAVNEAYGPSGTAGTVSLSAESAVNIIRTRAGMPDVLPEYLTSADKFRERIQNERCVELAFEGNHYYYDIRRWKIAPTTMGQTLYGMYIEKVPVSETYPNGKKYTRMALPNNRQCTWKDEMYYLPFSTEEMNKMKNFKENPVW